MTTPLADSAGPLVVVTPWYPTSEHPYHGVFVRDAVAALRLPPEQVRILHLQRVDVPTDHHVEQTDVGELVRLPVVVPPGTSRPGVARLQRDALRDSGLLDGASRLHAHVGIPTGWAVAAAAPAAARLVVTEHATYLRDELRTRAGAALYGDVLDRAAWLLTVSEAEARRLRASFPEHAARIRGLGNSVRARSDAAPPRLPGPLERWLYVGNLVERKGVRHVLAAFELFRQQRPGARLTIVGSGPEESGLREWADRLGVTDAVDFLGAQAPEDLGALSARGDVLVHLSSLETFGLTPVEAALEAMPVVVTRCEGPEETLFETALAGRAVFVPIRPEPHAVVDAVLALERHVPGHRDSRALADLQQRYGAGPWGARLGALLREDPADAAPSPVDPAHADGPARRRRIVVLALSPRGLRRTNRLARMTVRAGVDLVVVTSDRAETVAHGPGVTVVDVSDAVARTPHHLAERLLLDVLPQAVLGTAERLLGAVGGVPDPVGRAARAAGRRVTGLRDSARRAGARASERITHRFVHSVLDPVIVATYLERRDLLRGLARGADRVFYADSESLGAAWRIGRADGQVPIGRLPADLGFWELLDGWTTAAEDPLDVS